MGVLSRDLFTMIVAMAILTTMAMPPMLRWSLARLPLGRDERERLEREASDAKGFLPNAERLLLAVDESANGKFAARLAGCLAGARGLPVTVLHIGRRAPRQVQQRDEPTSAEAAIKAGAKSAAAVETEAGAPPPKVAITTRVRAGPTETAVADEARKGYDLLIAGLGKTGLDKGRIHRGVARVAAGFDGPLLVVAARGTHLEAPLDSGMKILVPVTGTPVSRLAAEIALALAQANGAPVTALHIASSDGGRRRGASPARDNEEAILKDTVALAERYRAELATAVRIDVAPEDAILREAERGGYDLIVMGVNRRPGGTLFFGNVAAAVLKGAPASILFVAG
jgi:nucleotide-binding universal stress UspA family protein